MENLGALMMDLEGLQLSNAEEELIRQPVIGGLILFSRNYENKSQLHELINSIRQIRSEIIVLDLYNSNSPVIKERAFSDSARTVVELARSYIAGMHEAGMVATGKHFPGHGSVLQDSHHDLPKDERDAAEILENDLRPFAECIDMLDAVMPAHVIYPAIDTRCAGYSEVWIKQKLRQELGFEGVVFSDDLTMAGAHSAGTIEARAELALSAGCDMILVCNNRSATIKVIEWLDKQGQEGNSKLSKMKATPSDNIGLIYDSDRWLKAKDLVKKLKTNSRS
jgi:beta-N-acetylhexosaminidase